MFGSSSAMRTLRRPGFMASGGLAQRRLIDEREREREACPLARPAAHPQPAAGVLDDAAADVQAKPAALRLAGERVSRLAELLEDQLLVLQADSRAIVADVEPQESALLGERNLHPAAARLDEFNRVREQVHHDLNDPVQ